MSKRKNISPLWNFFTKESGVDSFKAKCNLCSRVLSYRSSTGNLNSHLKVRHGASYSKLMSKRIEDRSDADVDDDSNSSVKFSSEIWSYFESAGEVASCALCRRETANTVEDMRAHLEEEHPGHMIGILNNKNAKEDDDATDDEKAVDPIEEEEVFTDVLYLEEEPKPRPAKRRRSSRTQHKPVRISEQRSEPQKHNIEYKIVEKPSECRPEIDSFLNYITVLLKNVPRETIPKLQLDIISLILNAQMANNGPATGSAPVATAVAIPVTTAVAIPVTSEINTGGILHTDNVKYHITVENGLVQKSP